jgi:mRNA interferase RelE/StbE
MIKHLLWSIEFSDTAQKQFIKLDKSVQMRIESFLKVRLATLPEPKVLGKQLTGKWSPLWRFRVGDYRIIADILDDRLIIQVIEMGHRRDIYH